MRSQEARDWSGRASERTDRAQRSSPGSRTGVGVGDGDCLLRVEIIIQFASCLSSFACWVSGSQQGCETGEHPGVSLVELREAMGWARAAPRGLRILLGSA